MASDAKFLAEMVPHHRSAIEMAQLALSRAKHPEIRALATRIIAAQTSEITEMAAIRKQLAAGPSQPSAGAGMHGSMTPGDMTRLRGAQPFDAMFIEMMVPHHQDAIVMSRAVLKMGSDAQTKRLARRIIDAQAAEIRQMREWYRRWYGKALPSTGVTSPSGMAHGTAHSG